MTDPEPLKDCIGNDINVGDFVIYVVQGNRNAGINFGYILELNDKRKKHIRQHDGKEYWSGDIAVKIQHSDYSGTRQTVRVVDVEGHWMPGTPPEVIDYQENYYNRDNNPLSWQDYREARQNYWIAATHRDSGKPSTTTIRCSGGREHRLFITKPV